MAWKCATPEERRAKKQAWYAARRSKGLCVTCPMPSEKYARCLCCRTEHRRAQRTWEAAYRRTHRPQIRQRARAAYAQAVGRPVRAYRWHVPTRKAA